MKTQILIYLDLVLDNTHFNGIILKINIDICIDKYSLIKNTNIYLVYVCHITIFILFGLLVIHVVGINCNWIVDYGVNDFFFCKNYSIYLFYVISLGNFMR